MDFLQKKRHRIEFENSGNTDKETKKINIGLQKYLNI